MDTLLQIAGALARIAVGLLLVVAGWSKLRHGAGLFLKAILAYDLVPHRVASALVRAIPRLEIACGAAVVLGFATTPAVVAAFAMIVAFTSAIVVSLLRGRRHFCGCLGFTGDQVNSVQWALVYRNAGMLACLVLAVSSADALRIDALIGIPLAAPPWLVAAMATGTAIAAAGMAILHVASAKVRETRRPSLGS